MKAILIRPPASLDRLDIVDVPDPGMPGAGEVRVRVRASSLNFHDYALAVGKLPLSGERVALGECAGTVEAVGAGVDAFSVGDDVISRYLPTWLDGDPRTADFATCPGDGVDGFACEVVVRPSTWFTRAPRGLDHVEAATVPVAAVTAWRALVPEGGLKGGDSVLVLGTGGVSIYALQLAKAMGATVIATSSSARKLDRLRELGADEVIDYRSVPEWGREVLRLTGGRGVDHVLEVGGPGTLQQSMQAVRIGGHVSMIGILTGFAGEISTAALTLKQIRLKGIVVGSRGHQLDAVRAIEAGRLRPVLDRVYPLDRLAEGFRYLLSGEHVGKIGIAF